jgi:hypothetical protein
MEKGNKYFKMEMYILDNTTMEDQKALEYTFGVRVVQFIKVSLKMD